MTVRGWSKFDVAPLGGARLAYGWCLSNLQIPLPPLTPEKAFVIKLECWAEESAGASGGESNSGLTLSGLIDVFSRKGRDTQTRWGAQDFVCSCPPLHNACSLKTTQGNHEHMAHHSE